MKFTRYILLLSALQIMPLFAQNWEYYERRVDYYMKEKDYREAQNWALQQLQFTLEKYGDESGFYRRSTELLMEIHFSTGNADSCLYYGRIDSALQIKHGKPNRGDNYRKVLTYLGFAYQQKQQFGNAENVLLEAYSECVGHLADNDYECLDIKTFIADMYLQSGNFPKAQQYINELKEIRERDQKSNPLAFARILIKFSSLALAAGELGVADSAAMKSLGIYEKNGADTLADYPSALEFSARVAFAQGNVFKVNRIMKKFIKASAVIFGSGDIFYNSVNSYGELLQSIRFYTAGINLFGQTLAGVKQTSMNSLTMMKSASAFLDKAGLQDSALKLMDEVYRQESSSVTGLPLQIIATDANTLALMHGAAGDYGLAGQLFKNSLLMFDNVYGRNSPRHGLVMQNQAQVLAMEGRHQIAMETIDSALDILRPDTSNFLQFVMAMKTKAEILRMAGKTALASTALDTVVMTLGNIPPGHVYYPIFLNVYSEYAEVNIVEGNGRAVYKRVDEILADSEKNYYPANLQILKLRLLKSLAGIESGMKDAASDPVWSETTNFFMYDMPFLDFKSRKSFRDLSEFIAIRLTNIRNFKFTPEIYEFIYQSLRYDYSFHPSMMLGGNTENDRIILELAEISELKNLLASGIKSSGANPSVNLDTIANKQLAIINKIKKKDSILLEQILSLKQETDNCGRILIIENKDTKNIILLIRNSKGIKIINVGRDDFPDNSGEMKKVRAALSKKECIGIASNDGETMTKLTAYLTSIGFKVK